MVRDTTSSHLHIASCYEESEDSSIKKLKRSLTTTTRSSNSSALEAEEQTTRLEKDKRQGKGLAWKAFLRGSAIGFVLQFMIFTTCYTIFKIWDRNPTFSGPLSLVSFSLAFG